MNALKIKILPNSQNTNLDEIKNQVKEKIQDLGAKLNSSEEQEIAFGLKALILTIAWPENKDTDLAENIISSIPEVSSIEILDYRRGFG